MTLRDAIIIFFFVGVPLALLILSHVVAELEDREYRRLMGRE